MSSIKGSVIISVDSDEIRRVLKRFDKYNEVTQKAIIKEVDRSAYEIEEWAKRGVPVDTGRLRASIVTIPTNFKPDATVMAGIRKYGNMRSRKTGRQIRANTNYARDVEQRTPFMRFAVRRVTPKLLRNLKNIIINSRL